MGANPTRVPPIRPPRNDTQFPDLSLDLDNPALRVRIPAQRVKGWDLVETDQVIRALPSFENGRFHMVEHLVEGHFTFTPPLPERLADEVEWIDLVPYGNTLLRLTVFPDGMKKGN